MNILDRLLGVPRPMPRAADLQISFDTFDATLERYVPLTRYHVVSARRVASNPHYRDFFHLRRLAGAYLMLDADGSDGAVINAVAAVRPDEIFVRTGYEYNMLAKLYGNSVVFGMDPLFDKVVVPGSDHGRVWNILQRELVDAGVKVILLTRNAISLMGDNDIEFLPGVVYHARDSLLDNPALVGAVARTGKIRGVDTFAPSYSVIAGQGWWDMRAGADQSSLRLIMPEYHPSALDMTRIDTHTLDVLRWASGWGA